MKSRLFFLTGVLFVGLQVGSSTSLEAQQLWEEKIEGAAGQWNINILRPTGMPVIPFFEGWVANDDGTANLSDAACVLNWLFAGSPEPGCVAALNTNGDGDVNIADPVFLLNFLFAGGPGLSDPFPDCGLGTLPADIELGCANPSDCQ